MADARHRAQLYAQEADVKLGKIQSISEQGVQFPQPRFMAAQADAMRGAAPVSAGEEEVRVNVHVVYLLADSGSATKK
jgi:uncharacterized protein YggE